MNRQTFFRTLVVHGLRLFKPGVSIWGFLLDPPAEGDSHRDMDELYRAAMRLGIDPACMDRHQLGERVADQLSHAARDNEI